MSQSKLLIFSIIILVSILSCTGKRLLNQGKKYEESGLYKDAMDYYLQTLEHDDDNIDAKLGFKRTGDKVMSRILENFKSDFDLANYKEAVYHYKEALELKETGDKYFIDLRIPPAYIEYYNESKSNYLSERYKEALNLLENEDYSNAASVLKEIYEIDPDYKDTKGKFKIAVFEPHYLKAKKLMDSEKYRSAYNLFGEIIADVGNYRDCKRLKQKSRELGTINVAVLDFEGDIPSKELGELFRKEIESVFNKIKNPFVNLIEYDNSIKVPDVMIKGEIINYNYNPGYLSNEEVPGYLRKSALREEKIRRFNYKKIKYNVYKKKRSIAMSVSVSMINTKNNEILSTEQHSLSKTDMIHYADYSGDKSRLVPGYWKYFLLPNRNDVIKDYPKNVSNLQDLLKARRTIKSQDFLEKQIVEHIAGETLKSIEKYDPDKGV